MCMIWTMWVEYHRSSAAETIRAISTFDNLILHNCTLMCTWKLQGQNVMFAPVLSKEPVAPEKSARLCVFGGHCVDMWWLYTNCHFFAVLAVFWLFLTIGTLLVHCWYSIDRTDTTGTATVIFAVLTVYWLFLTIGTNRHRSTKTVPTVYHQCTNRKKQSKDSQNSSNDHWCTNRPMSTQSPPNTVAVRSYT